MEKDQKVLIGLIIFVLLVALGIGSYLFITKKDSRPDAIKFKSEYESLNEKTDDNKEKYLKVDISEDNLYVYKNDSEILDVLKNKTGIILFGYSKCSYCRSMVSILNDVAKEHKLDTIYYLDILNIRDSYEIMEQTVVKLTSGTNSYYEMLNILSEYLSDYYIKDSNDVEYNTGVKRIYAPTVVAVKDGKIVGFHEGTLDDVLNNKELDKKQEKELKKIYEKMIKEITGEDCKDKKCKN